MSLCKQIFGEICLRLKTHARAHTLSLYTLAHLITYLTYFLILLPTRVVGALH